jgi:pimeloyl-ACP methyl ester carboxylesterase
MRRYGTEPSILDTLRIREAHRPVDGETQHPVVVFVHGSMDRQAAFVRVLRHLPDVTTAVYDRRGYGASVDVPGPFDIDDQVADLDRVLDVVDPARGGVVLVGHSFGACTRRRGVRESDELGGLVADHDRRGSRRRDPS